MHELNIETLCANTPAAKGRVERAHSTRQDRLVKELRVQDICTLPAANAFACASSMKAVTSNTGSSPKAWDCNPMTRTLSLSRSAWLPGETSFSSSPPRPFYRPKAECAADGAGPV